MLEIAFESEFCFFKEVVSVFYFCTASMYVVLWFGISHKKGGESKKKEAH